MFTTKYKGLFIHGYFDKAKCIVNNEAATVFKVCRSLRAAQLFITKTLKEAT